MSTAEASTLEPSRGSTLAAGSRDRRNPSLFDAIRADPMLPIEAAAREDLVRDLRTRSRRYFSPPIRVITRFAVRLLIFVKRVLPFDLGWLKPLSIGTAWFGRRLVSPEAQRIVMRHFVIETLLLNFIARNAGRGVPEHDLMPTCFEEVGEWRGENAVALHDANVMNLLIDLGETPGVDVKTPRPLDQLDFSMLEIPPLRVDESKIVAGFDLSSALYISVFYIALFFDDLLIERAMNSFQLDESLMAALANLTGDDRFRAWTPVKFPTWLGSSTGDPARDLHWHIIVHEYAFHRLLELRAQADQARQTS
jgi:hypothetical protein